jgi:O-antigen/teichoic acid export membrane protein
LNDRAPTSRQQLVKNISYAFLAWLFPIVPTVFITPIIINTLGAEAYGIYLVMLTLTTYFFSFGIGRAATKYVSEFGANGETERVSGIISACVILTLSLGLVGTSVMAVFARDIVKDVLGITPEFQTEAVMAVYIACLNILVTMFAQIFLFVLQGIQRFDRYLVIININTIFLSVGSLLLVLNGYSVVALMAWALLTALLTTLFAFLAARSLVPTYAFTFRPSRDSWKLVLKYSGAIVGYQISGNILLLFERALITNLFGTASLTYYVVPMTLAMYLNMMSSSLLMGMFPVVNELLAQPSKLQRLYKKASKFLVTFLAFAVGSAILAGHLFLTVWMGPAFAEISYPLLVLHVLTFGILAAGSVTWQVAEAFGRPALNALAAFLWLAVAAPLMVVLATTWTVYGIGMARLVGSAIFIIISVYVEKRFIGGLHYRFWFTTLTRISAASLTALLVQWIILREMPPTWTTLFLGLFTSSILYLLALLILRHFDEEDLLVFRSTFAGVFR